MTGVAGIGLQLQADPVSAQQLRGNEPVGGTASAQHEQDFANAVQRSSPIEQIDAQPASSGNGIMSNAMQRLDAIGNHLHVESVGKTETPHQQTLLAGDPASAPLPPPAKATNGLQSISDAADKALDSFNHSVAFSVEAQAINSSSQAVTKVWDNLMKGQ